MNVEFSKATRNNYIGQNEHIVWHYNGAKVNNSADLSSIISKIKTNPEQNAKSQVLIAGFGDNGRQKIISDVFGVIFNSFTVNEELLKNFKISRELLKAFCSHATAASQDTPAAWITYGFSFDQSLTSIHAIEIGCEYLEAALFTDHIGEFESNFHVLLSLHPTLNDATYFPALSGTEHVTSPMNFDNIKKQLEELGVDNVAEISSLLQGLLYLSRVRYTEQGLQNEDDLERAGELLKLETSSHKLFERYTIYDDNEKIKITSSVHRANNFLRMTVQFIYGKIVAWILRAMNKKLAPMNTRTPKEAPIHFEVLNYSSPKLRMEARLSAFLTNVLNEEILAGVTSKLGIEKRFKTSMEELSLNKFTQIASKTMLGSMQKDFSMIEAWDRSDKKFPLTLAANRIRISHTTGAVEYLLYETSLDRLENRPDALRYDTSLQNIYPSFLSFTSAEKYLKSLITAKKSEYCYFICNIDLSIDKQPRHFHRSVIQQQLHVIHNGSLPVYRFTFDQFIAKVGNLPNIFEATSAPLMLANLPLELVENVIKYVDTETLVICSQVSYAWQVIAVKYGAIFSPYEHSVIDRKRCKALERLEIGKKLKLKVRSNAVVIENREECDKLEKRNQISLQEYIKGKEFSLTQAFHCKKDPSSFNFTAGTKVTIAQMQCGWVYVKHTEIYGREGWVPLCLIQMQPAPEKKTRRKK